MSLKEIQQAHKRIASFIHRTPVFTNNSVDKITGRQVFFKAECMQKTGSFKIRGATNAILCMKERGLDIKGVVTHSSGNHGQAVAHAAQRAGVSCSVVIPDITSKVKIEAIKGYGAEAVFCEFTPQSRQSVCDAVRKEKGYEFIPPYDHYDVIAGQGTVALELLEQVPDLDAILIPCSGGGLSSGIAIATKAISPKTKVFAVEVEGKDLERCLKAGERLWPNPPRMLKTIANGISTQQLGQLTWPILKELAEKEVFTVNDEEITEAMRFAWTRLKVVIEEAAAAGVAAVLSDRMKDMDPALKRVAVILCGGNVDLDKLPWVVNASNRTEKNMKEFETVK